MYVCRSPFDLFLSAAPPSCTHLRICRQALPIIATSPSSETDGAGENSASIFTRKRRGGVCWPRRYDHPSDQTTTLQDLGLPGERTSFRGVELLFYGCQCCVVISLYVSMKVNSWSTDLLPFPYIVTSPQRPSQLDANTTDPLSILSCENLSDQPTWCPPWSVMAPPPNDAC